MKIDLHIHTKKSPSDNGNDREISAENFVKKMIESNVGIAAITNHNMFDCNQYNEINKIIDKNKHNLLVLPGAEIDVRLKNIDDRIQVNLIISKNNVNDLQSFFNKNTITYKKPIMFHSLLEFFKNIKFILYVDIKQINNDKRLEIDQEINSLINENVVLLYDVKNYDDFKILIEHDQKALISTDILFWDKYLEESKKLFSYYISIDNFDVLYNYIKKHKIQEIFINDIDILNMKKFEIKSNDKTKKWILNEIKIIKNSINVIFGAKASGKSEFLKSIYEHIESPKKILLECSKNSPEEIKNQITSKYNIYTNEQNNVKDFIDKLLIEIQDYKEDNDEVQTIHNLLNSIKSHIKWEFVSIDNILCIPYRYNLRVKQIITQSNNLLDNIKNYKSSEEEFDKNNNFDAINNQCSEIYSIIKYYRNLFVEKNKNFFIYRINKELQNNINNIYKNHKGKSISKWEPGLINLFSKRRWLLQKINEINKNLNKLIGNISDTKKEFKIPIENSNEYNIWQICNKVDYRKASKGNTYKKDLLYVLEIDDYANYMDRINVLKKSSKEDIFESKIVFKKNGETGMELSSGDLHYIHLELFLENNEYDYYFIDEPETALSSKIISENILIKFQKLINYNKTIIFTTHNSILGLNTKPFNYFLRESRMYKDGNTYVTWNGNLSENVFYDVNNIYQQILIKEKLLEYFEGNYSLYNERRDIYGK